MKTWHYPHGRIALRTMTVGELRELLAGYPDDLPVVPTYEGTWGSLHQSCTAVESVSFGRDDDREHCLILDVER